MNETEVVLLLSGGIDSTTLLAELSSKGKKVHALSFDYGQRHQAELYFAGMNAGFYEVLAHHIVKLDLASIASVSLLTNPNMQATNYQGKTLPDRPDESYVPGRNLMMLSYAAAYAEAHHLNEIYFAANADDGLRFPDCSTSFMNKLNQLWQTGLNTAGIQVHTPFIHLTKAEVIQISMQLGVNLEHTLSCYAPSGNAECGICLSCLLKQDAMHKAMSNI